MLSVTARISSVQQPHGGYISADKFDEDVYFDDMHLNDVEPGLKTVIGLAVDYLSRFMILGDVRRAFDISIKGAFLVDNAMGNHDETAKLEQLIRLIDSLNDKSIIAACKLTGYDVAVRRGVRWFVPIDSIMPTEKVIDNIRVLVRRTVAFFEKNGPITKCGFDFAGGYTSVISSGDGDYLTDDTLWELKCSNTGITIDRSLQVLVYYLLGYHSVYPEFKNIHRLGIYNPELNIAYTVNLQDIDDETFYIVSRSVIGYEMAEPEFIYKSKPYRVIDNRSSWRRITGKTDKAVLSALVTEIFSETNFDVNNFSDGIHEISVDDYWTFVRRTFYPDKQYVKKPFFNNTEKIVFLKNSGYIMFISVTSTGKMSVLYKAAKQSLKYRVDYYYDNMKEYAVRISKPFSKYWKSLSEISNIIKSIEPDIDVLRKNHYSEYVAYCKAYGMKIKDFDEWFIEEGKNLRFSGKIHGCIVDLDYTNHVYLNPNDGKITPYSAMSMFNKDVYKNMYSLIAAKRPEMLLSYESYVNRKEFELSESTSNHLIEMSDVSQVILDTEKVYEYDMYAVTNKLCKIQPIFEHKLITNWYENVLPKPVNLKDRGKNLLVDKTIQPNSNDVNHNIKDVQVKNGDCSDKAYMIKKGKVISPPMIGKIFGGLKVVKQISINEYICKCKCCNRIEASYNDLMDGHVTSCGCGVRDYSSYVGCSKVMKCGMKATVIEDYDYKNITIEFEDGTIRKNIRRDRFKDGNVGHSV